MVLCLHCGYFFLVDFIKTYLFGKPERHQEAAGASRGTSKTMSSKQSTVKACSNFLVAEIISLCVPATLVCSLLLRLLRPAPPPPSPAVLVGVFFCPPPPFPLCFLPCGTLFPARTHDSTAHVFGSRFLSVLASCPFALLRLAPWRFPAMPGERPSLASLSSLPSLLPVSRPPPYCCSPALCALRWSSPRQGCIWRALTRLWASALCSIL